jgi:hypothetical protein
MVQVNLVSAVNESVDAGLAKAGIPDTPHNRIDVLSGMHKKLVEEEPSTYSIRPILIAIEDEIIRLQDELVS